ncbi:MAG: hypothetical protein GY927_11450 [bacterium]|nr:hypothetical protein [bacterium]
MTTTIQETGKRLKVHILISALLFWGGFITVLVNAQAGEISHPGGLACVLGLVWYIVTKFRVWWGHG